MILKLNEVELRLYRGNGYNTPSQNERTIELSLAEYFLNKFNNNSIIEIGAVTPYYFNSSHKIIDPFDPYKFAERIDARNYQYFNKNVLSISTIEHIGNGEFNSSIDDSAFILLDRITKESDNYLITIPLGYNFKLESAIERSDLNFIIFERINTANEWKLNEEKSFQFKYDFPYNNANAICVITNLKFFRDLQSKKLNLGCGDDYRDGWINVDIGNCKKDIEHNLEELPLPFDDNSFDYILLQQVLEHIDRAKFPKFMEDLHRISNNGCQIHIEVPYYNSKNAWTDFTHKNFFTEESFGYFDNSHHLRHLGIIYNINFTFKSNKINFKGPADNLTIIYDLEVEK